MTKETKTMQLRGVLCAAVLLSLGACATTQEAPATAEVAASKKAVEKAASVGAADLAPVEMNSAHAKMVAANQALAAKDYKQARDLANQAQAEAKLAQSKANTAKANAAANK
jgi:uncharacterized protein involved in high-affinity Fe2+ transport